MMRQYKEFLPERLWDEYPQFKVSLKSLLALSKYILDEWYQRSESCAQLEECYKETQHWQLHRYIDGEMLFYDHYDVMMPHFHVPNHPGHSVESSMVFVDRLLKEWGEGMEFCFGMSDIHEFMDQLRQPGEREKYEEGTLGRALHDYFHNHKIEYMLDRNERLNRPWWAGLFYNEEYENAFAERAPKDVVEARQRINATLTCGHDFQHVLYNVGPSPTGEVTAAAPTLVLVPMPWLLYQHKVTAIHQCWWNLSFKPWRGYKQQMQLIYDQINTTKAPSQILPWNVLMDMPVNDVRRKYNIKISRIVQEMDSYENRFHQPVDEEFLV